jgi:hypothetical protein
LGRAPERWVDNIWQMDNGTHKYFEGEEHVMIEGRSKLYDALWAGVGTRMRHISIGDHDDLGR